MRGQPRWPTGHVGRRMSTHIGAARNTADASTVYRTEFNVAWNLRFLRAIALSDALGLHGVRSQRKSGFVSRLPASIAEGNRYRHSPQKCLADQAVSQRGQDQVVEVLPLVDKSRETLRQVNCLVRRKVVDEPLDLLDPAAAGEEFLCGTRLRIRVQENHQGRQMDETVALVGVVHDHALTVASIRLATCSSRTSRPHQRRYRRAGPVRRRRPWPLAFSSPSHDGPTYLPTNFGEARPYQRRWSQPPLQSPSP